MWPTIAEAVIATVTGSERPEVGTVLEYDNAKFCAVAPAAVVITLNKRQPAPFVYRSVGVPVSV
jgi:hypothetical protein